MEMNDEALQFDLTDDDRKDLLATTRTPGYRIMQRILASYALSLREGAAALSMDNPLGDSQRISNAWAYAKMASTLNAALDAGIKFELDLLQRRETQTDPATVARKRREHFALEAIPAEVNPNVSHRRGTK